MVCKIMRWNSDGMSEHKKWFERDRRIVYTESVVCFGGYSFLLSLLILCIAKQVTTLKQLRSVSCLDFLKMNIEPFVIFSDFTLLSAISPMPDHARYTRTCFTSSYLIVNVPISLDRV